MKRNPAGAFWLSVLPGLGHIYIGQVAKGFLLAMVLVGLINLADAGPDAIGILIPVYWIFVMLDAHRSALEVNRLAESGRPLPDPFRLDFGKWWGWALVGLGVILLLSNLEIVDLQWVWRLWPVALIAIGIHLVRGHSYPPSSSPPTLPSVPAEAGPESGLGDESAESTSDDRVGTEER